MTRTTSFIALATLFAAVCVGALVLSLMSRQQIAFGNPSQVYRNNPTIATTTLTYLTLGTAATTTNTWDTQADGAAIADSAAFTACLTGSSTNTVLNTAFEYSYDNLTWLQSNLSASSTQGVAVNDISGIPSLTWKFASSTLLGGVPGLAASTTCKILSVQTPLRYVRAVMSITGTNGGVWSDFAGKREQR